MKKRSTFHLACVSFVLIIFASAVFGSVDPIHYTIRVNAADFTGFDVEMQIPNARGKVHIAMAAHPEYDDRYFRYVENFSAESGGRKLAFAKPDEAVWQIDGVRGG